ncbi:Hypothetical predicted protein [Cloeon dipterum]|uniref:Uncharacterized protein n=1 Tax=Cloeon dipterum TaxID=197152 RepID=A0A8S1C1R6_9INSE|nr:Hypothetical predicted protein [Cloeon dipterum]
MRRQVLFWTLLVLLAAPSLARPFEEDEYVDEDEPMDPPSPYHRPQMTASIAKKSSPAPAVLSYPTALDGAKDVKPTQPSLIHQQKFKLARPVYVTPPTDTVDEKPSFTPEEIPLTKTVRTTNKLSVVVPKKEHQPASAVRPIVKKPVARPATKDKKIRPSQSVVSAKYAHHPSHTHATFPHFLPTVQPTYQMIPAAQQEYYVATIGAVSGGSVDDDHQPFSAGYGHQEEHGDSDAKYEFMYRVQGDNKYYGKEEDDSHGEPSDFGHSEAREGGRTWGRYYVKLPDGRVQTVRYWADHTGYHAEVLFQGEAQHPAADEPQYANHASPSLAEVQPESVYSPQPAYVPTHAYYAADASEPVAVKTHRV